MACRNGAMAVIILQYNAADRKCIETAYLENMIWPGNKGPFIIIKDTYFWSRFVLFSDGCKNPGRGLRPRLHTGGLGGKMIIIGYIETYMSRMRSFPV